MSDLPDSITIGEYQGNTMGSVNVPGVYLVGEKTTAAEMLKSELRQTTAVYYAPSFPDGFLIKHPFIGIALYRQQDGVCVRSQMHLSDRDIYKLEKFA